MRTSFLVSVALLGLVLPLSGVAANHPTEGACTPSVQGEASVVMSPATGAIQPYCTAIASGDHVTWIRGDPFDPSGPENGCFAARDAGPFHLGDRFTVRFVWDTVGQELRIRVWDTAGEPVHWQAADGSLVDEKTCLTDDLFVAEGRVTVPWATVTRSAAGVIHIVPV